MSTNKWHNSTMKGLIDTEPLRKDITIQPTKLYKDTLNKNT